MDKGEKEMKIDYKKTLITLFFLAFGLGIVLVSAFRVGQIEVQAQIEVKEGGIGNVLDIKNNSVVDYYLPYPGILPDHPLYWLKMIRDRVILSFTKNPEERFDRFLLYADKRVGAAKALIKGNKIELGITTATKGEKYLGQAVSQFNLLVESDKAMPEMQSRITKAVLKHEEVLKGVLNKLPDQARANFMQTIENIVQNLDRIKS